MSNNQKVTKHIKFEPNDLEILKQQFPHCFDQCGNFQFEKFKDYLNQNNIPLSSEHYHLNWLGKSYARILATDPTATLLKADTQHHQKDENMKSGNLLIKGDNLDVLKHLVHAYYEKVKMIYIDPPYNTGNDGFIYQDDRKFTVEQLMGMIGGDRGQAERILKFVSGGSNGHSAWLSFMYPRLYLARQLLREDGVIFVSIDDHEVAQLRLLMDEIFGEENFVADLIRKTKSTTNDAKVGVNIQHDNCLIFSKNKNLINLFGGQKDLSNYKNPDHDPNGDWISDNPSAKSGGQLNYFEIKNPYTGKIDLPPTGRYWIFSKNTIDTHIENGVLYFKKEHKENERGFIYKRYKDKLKTNQQTLDSLLFAENLYMNQNATKDLLSFGLAEYFSYPKSSEFLLKLVQHSTNNNDIILDFFAGSGTTAHAVMQLNAEDGGNRKFILVQIPEPIDPKNNKSAYDFVKNDLNATPTIFEITKERLIRASKQIATTLKEKIQSKELNLSDLESQPDLYNSNQEKINQLKSEIQSLKSQDIHFKIFETVPIWPNYNDEIAEFSSDLKLFDETMLTSEDLQSLLITWKTYDGIPLTQELEEIKLNDYIAHYGNQKLYLIYKSFTIDHLTLLLNRIEDQKDFNPTTIILFAYHFESTILRSISEGIKTYNGRKQLQIDVINRY